MWPNLTQHVKTSQDGDMARIDRLIALSWFSGSRGAWPFVVGGVTYLVDVVSVCAVKEREREREKKKKEKKREEEKEKKETCKMKGQDKRREKKRREEKREAKKREEKR